MENIQWWIIRYNQLIFATRNGRYLKKNNYVESANISDLVVTCHFRKIDYVISNFLGIRNKDVF